MAGSIAVLASDLISTAKRRLAQLSAACKLVFGRIGVIESGLGKGLRFDAGPGSEDFTSGGYERPVQEALASLVKSGVVCYDVGANLGFFSLLLSRLSGPAGSVYAFEPVPGNAAMIERNARLNGMGNIKVLTMALSRTDGRGELLLARHIGGAVLKGAGIPPDPAGRIIVETRAIDSLVDSRRIEPPDVVKIDVEGAEIDVLQGMAQVLQARTPTIILELDDETEAACGRKISLCRSYLGDLDYRITCLQDAYPHGRWFVRHLVAVRKESPVDGPAR